MIRTHAKGWIVEWAVIVFGLAGIGLIVWYIVAVESSIQWERREDQLQQVGLGGQHDLRRIKQVNGISGRLGGSFFLGIGSVSGNLSSERTLLFYWGRSAEEFIPTTLPNSMFRFVIDESRIVPTVEFVFTREWLNSPKRAHVYTESEKLGLNLNQWLENNRNLKLAVVRISRKDFEKEVILAGE